MDLPADFLNALQRAQRIHRRLQPVFYDYYYFEHYDEFGPDGHGEEREEEDDDDSSSNQEILVALGPLTNEAECSPGTCVN